MWILNKQNSDYCPEGYQHSIKSIAWFAQIARKKYLTANKINIMLGELVNFINQKENEKEEAIAELQLARAYKELFLDRLVKVQSIKHGQK